MLVRVNSWLRTGQRRTADDDGASIVAVLGIMLIGFMAVALVASATMFAITSTKTSGDRTQALISAESGRDAVYAALASGACSTDPYTGTDPGYTAKVYASSADTAPKDATGLSVGCPDANTKFVVISSKGTAQGATATVDAVYPVQREIVRMGPAIGSSGSFATTLSAYYGDVVVSGHAKNFSCPVAATIHGDVYVLDGDANLGLALCTIKGDLRVSGDVTIPLGLLSLLSRADGKMVAGGTIPSGLLGALLVAAQGKYPKSNPFDAPSKSEIERAISWFDLNENTVWPGFERHEYPDGACGTAVTSDIRARLGTSGGPIVLDAKGCNDALSFVLTNLVVRRDAVVLVDKGITMPLSTVSADQGNRNLYIVQTNKSVDPQHPAPNCAADRGSLQITPYSGLLQYSPRTLIYSPCDVNGFKLLTGTKGQVIAPSADRFALLSADTCVPFSVPGVLTLSCSIKDTAGGASSAGTLGRLLQQTEH